VLHPIGVAEIIQLEPDQGNSCAGNLLSLVAAP